MNMIENLYHIGSSLILTKTIYIRSLSFWRINVILFLLNDVKSFKGLFNTLSPVNSLLINFNLYMCIYKVTQIFKNHKVWFWRIFTTSTWFRAYNVKSNPTTYQWLYFKISFYRIIKFGLSQNDQIKHVYSFLFVLYSDISFPHKAYFFITICTKILMRYGFKIFVYSILYIQF